MSSEYRGRGRSSSWRGGPPRGGGFRGGRGGGYMIDREGGRGGGGFRGRGGFSRGRGGPPRSRDDMSPPRMSRSYDTDRVRGPPPSRRPDRYEDSFDRAPDRGPSMRMKDMYSSSPPRDSGRSFDRHSPPPRRERDYPPRHSDHMSSRDYLSPRSYSPPRDSGYSSYKDSYSSAPREERRPIRDYPPPRGSTDYDSHRGGSSRDFRDAPRGGDYSSRDYPPPSSSSRNGDFRESLSSRDFRDAPRGGDRYGSGGGRGGSSRGRSRFEDSRGPPPREYSSRGRGGDRDDDRGSRGFMNGGCGEGGVERRPAEWWELPVVAVAATWSCTNPHRYQSADEEEGKLEFEVSDKTVPWLLATSSSLSSGTSCLAMRRQRRRVVGG